ncbi:MAG: hypothetical protein ACYC3L_01230 [Gemmatimonadaceae bacterium]
MSEAWKMSADGWKTEKERPDDPEWWYETRHVDEDGNVVGSGWFLIGAQVQYRRKAQDVIAAEARKRAERDASCQLAFDMLPVLRAEGTFSCPKCGGTRAKMLRYISSREFGDRETIARTCKGCRFVWHEKPLDWEHPV